MLPLDYVIFHERNFGLREDNLCYPSDKLFPTFYDMWAPEYIMFLFSDT